MDQDFIEVIDMRGRKLAIAISDISYVFQRDRTDYATVVMCTREIVIELGNTYQDIVDRLSIR